MRRLLSLAALPARSSLACALLTVAALGIGSETAHARVTLVKNTSQTSAGFASISDSHGGVAQEFTTGSHSDGYALDTIGVGFGGSFPTSLTATVRKVSGSVPGAILYTLMNPETLASHRVNVFTAPENATLSANTSYFVAIAYSGGNIRLDRTHSDNEDSGGSDGWSIGDTFKRHFFGNTWQDHVSASSLLISIEGSLIGVAANAAPSFPALAATELEVAENTPAGMAIGEPYTATDANTDDRLSYSLEGTDATSFEIDSTGQLTTKAALDYETKSSYKVTVTVSDGTASATIDVTIKVTDVDEKPEKPDAPTVTATAGSATSLDVSWQAPANTGPAIQSYDLRYKKSADATWTDGPQDVAGKSATIDTGLEASTDYEVQVRATSDEGDSVWSASGAGTTGATVSGDPTVTIAAADDAVSEADGAVVFTLTRTGATTAKLTVQVQVTEEGDVLANAAAYATPVDVEFGIGDDTAKLVVALDDDSAYDPDLVDPTKRVGGRVTAAVQAGTGYVPGAVSSVTVDVTDDEDSPLTATLTLEPASPVAESVGTVTVVLTVETAAGGRQPRKTYASTISSRSETARSAEGDFEVLTETVLVPPSEFALDETVWRATLTWTIDIYDDDLDEDNETFRVITETPPPSVRSNLPATDTLTVTIVDNDDVPGAPTTLAATAGDAKVTLGWGAPSEPGTSTVTGYEYRQSRDGGSTWGSWTAAGDVREKEIAGLTNGAEYTFEVRAVSAAGDGAAERIAETPAAANAAPRFTSSATADVVENTTEVLTVVATDSDTADSVTGYALTGGADQAQFAIDATSGVLTFADAPDYETPTSAGPDNSYVVIVQATSGAGDRALTATQTITVTVTDVAEPPAAPAAPTFPSATASGLTVSWAAPANAGPAISDYDVRWRVKTPPGSWVEADDTTASTALTATITGLAAATEYEVQVRAGNDEGDGAWSASGTGSTEPALAPTLERNAAEYISLEKAFDPPLNTAGGRPIVIRIYWGAAVSGFEASEVRVVNGTATHLARAQGPLSAITVVADPGFSGTMTVQVPADVVEGGNRASNVLAFEIDQRSPVLTTFATAAEQPLTGAFDLDLGFDEGVVLRRSNLELAGADVYGLDKADVPMFRLDRNERVPQSFSDFAAVGTTEPIGNGHVYRRFAYTGLTPPAGYEGRIALRMLEGPRNPPIDQHRGAYDVHGNPVEAAELILEVDTKRPTAVVSREGGPVNGAFDVGIEFHEPVTGFEADDVSVTGGTAASLEGEGHSYTLRIDPAAPGPGEVSVQVKRDTVADAAGNANDASNAYRVATDYVAPTAEITSAASDPIAGAIVVTVGFDEEVRGLLESEIEVVNGAKSEFSGSGERYSLKVTPTVESGTLTVGLPAGTVEDLAGNSSTAAASFTRQVTNGAFVTVSSAAPLPANGAFTVDLAFSRDVTGLTLDAIAVTNGAKAKLAGEGRAYSVEITPPAGFEGETTVTVPAGAAQDADAIGNQAGSGDFAVDTVAPSIAGITSTAAFPTNAAFTVDVAFSEEVTGLTLEDIEVAHGSRSGLSGSGRAWSVRVAPDPEFDGEVTVTVKAGAVADAAGNRNPAPAAPKAFRVKTTRPTAVITSAPTEEPAGTERIDVIVTFSEPVTNFFGAEIEVVLAGTTEVFDGVVQKPRGAAAVYRATLSSAADSGIFHVRVAEGAGQDTVGNWTREARASIPFGAGAGRGPLIAITSSPGSGDTYKTGDAITFSATYGEDVTATGTADDPLVLNLTVGSAGRPAAHTGGGGRGVAFSYTVQAGDRDENGIGVNENGLAGGAIVKADGTAASRVFAALADHSAHKVDGVAPALESLAISSAPAAGAYAAGERLELLATFSEAVHVEGGPRIPVLVGATTRQAAYLDGSGSAALRFGYRVQAPDRDGDGVSVAADALELNNGSIRDAAGNGAETGHDAIAADTAQKVDGIAVIPTLTVPGGPVNGAFDVTIAFSHGVTEFLRTDIAVTNGAVAAFDAVDARTYTARIRPLASGEVTVRIEAGVAKYASDPLVLNRASAGAAVTADLDLPLATIASGATHPVNAPFEVILAFGEEVTGLDLGDDVTVAGGRRSSELRRISGREYRFEVTPPAGSAGTVTVTLRAGAVADPAGNANPEAAAGFAVDTLAPAVAGVAIAGMPAAAAGYAAGERIEVTVRFDETVLVTGSPTVALLLDSGTRQAVYDGGSGTPALIFAYAVVATDSDADGVGIAADSLALNGAAITDPAGNPATLAHAAVPVSGDRKVNGPAALGGSVAVSTVALTSAPGLAAYRAGEAIEVSVTFTGEVDVEGMPDVTLSVGPALRRAAYHDGSGTATLRFRYTVASQDLDPDGATVNADSLKLRGGGIVKSGTTEAADLTHAALLDQPAHPVDGITPVLESAEVNGIALTLTFSEALNQHSRPPATAFTLSLDAGTAPGVARVAVSGTTVTLTLSLAVAATDKVTLAYGAPAAMPIEDRAGNDAAAFDARTVDNATPAAANRAATGAPAIAGTPRLGEALAATPGTIADDDGLTMAVYAWQWIRTGDGVDGDIPGATGASYTPAADDVGKALKVRARFIDDAGHAESRVSGPTAAVAAGAAPVVTLILTPDSIGENGGVSMVSATVSPSSQAAFTVTVSAAAVWPAAAADFTLSANRTLSFAAKAGSSTGFVTITAIDNDVVAANKEVTVSGSATGGTNVTGPAPVTLTVTDDDAEAPGAPAAPTFPSATASSLTVNWAAPTNAGPAISDYDVRWRVKGSGATWTELEDTTDSMALSATITGLAAATEYEVQVRAENDEGTGAWSPSGDGTTNAVANAAPTFTSSATASVVEHATTTVLTVVATDSDTADSVTGYALTGGADQAQFAIDGSSGALTFAAAPDYETPTSAGPDNTYVVIVQATSGAGDRALTATQTITVTVTDVAEPPAAPAAPTFPSATASSLTVSWAAPTNAGPAISDYDVRWRVKTPPGSWTELADTTDSTDLTATITGLAASTEYEVQVRAQSPEGTSDWSPSGDGTTNAAANAAPTFTSSATASVVEHATTTVLTVVATDSDTADSVTGYALTGGADQAQFEIDATSGVLTFGTEPDYEDPTDAEPYNSYVVIVQATSGAGDRALTATQTITVTVTDVAEAPAAPAAPTFPSATASSLTVNWAAPTNAGPAISDYDVRWRVKTPPGSWVEAADTTDSTDLSATITGLTASTEYEVQVRAQSPEGTSDWSASGDGTTNAAANAAPTFTSSATAEVEENTTTVLTVVATDSDTADSVTGYALTGGADQAQFAIDATSGVLTFGTEPDYEDPTDAEPDNSYVVIVQATSGAGDRALTATQTITVTVTDVAEAPAAPAAPTFPSATASSLTVSWAAPTNAGPAITDYDVRWRVKGSGATWTELEDTTDSTDLSATITGLAAATEYEVQVRAENAEGTGAWSPSGDGTTNAVANAAPTFTSPATASVVEHATTTVLTVVATDSDTADSVTGYALTGGADQAQFEIDATSGVLTFDMAPDYEDPTDAEPYNSYVVIVQATSGAGDRALTATQTITVTVTDVAEPPAAPAAPTFPSATASGLTVNWAAPTNAGPAITDYDVRWRVKTPPGSWTELDDTTDSTALTATITGLTAATEYEVQVRAQNAEGTGEWSASSDGTTGTPTAAAPGQVTTVVVTAGVTQLTVSWAAVTGADGYTVQWKSGSQEYDVTRQYVVTDGATTSYTIPNLTAGTTYTVRVLATKANTAAGLPSVEMTGTPMAANTAPAFMCATVDGTQVVLTYDKALDATSTPAGNAFTVTVDDDPLTVLKVEIKGMTVILTLAEAVKPDEAVTLSYDAGGVDGSPYIQDETGLPAVNLVTERVTNATQTPMLVDATVDGTQVVLPYDEALDATSEPFPAAFTVMVAGSELTVVAVTIHGMTVTLTLAEAVKPDEAVTLGYDAGGVDGSPYIQDETGLPAVNLVTERVTNATQTPMLVDATVDGTQVVLTYDEALDATSEPFPAAFTVMVAGSELTVVAVTIHGMTVTLTLAEAVKPDEAVTLGYDAGPVVGSPYIQDETGIPASNLQRQAVTNPLQGSPARFRRLNREILALHALALSDQTSQALTQRLATLRLGQPETAQYQLGGAGSLAQTLHATLTAGQGQGAPRVDLKELLGTSSFVLPLRLTATGLGLDRVTVWGQGAYTNLARDADATLDWDGDTVSAQVGADVRLQPDLLAGVTVTWADSGVDYQARPGPGRAVGGTHENWLVSLQPYLGWQSATGVGLWATVGYGWGEVTLTDDQVGTQESDLTLQTAAVGARGPLLRQTGVLGPGATTVTLKSDATVTRVDVAGNGAAVAEQVVDAGRLRLLLEGQHVHETPTGARVAPFVELGVRYDLGDGLTGVGAELGGGVRYTVPRLGLTVEGRGRGLVGHRGYTEWGATGLVRVDPGVAGHGLAVTLAPTYGPAASRVQQLWAQAPGQAGGGAPNGLGPPPQAGVETEVGYGLAEVAGARVFTPYGAATLGRGAGAQYRLGGRWTGATGLRVSLEGVRQEAAGPQPATQGIRLQAGWAF